MPIRKEKVLVKLSAPARLDGMLTRDTFDVPHTSEGVQFMSWWDKNSSANRDAVLSCANQENICVTEALAKLSEELSASTDN